MKRIFNKKKIKICILIVVLVDVVIGGLLLTNRSFPRLAMWNIIESDKQDNFYWKPENKPDYFYFEPDSDKLSIFRNEILPLLKDGTNELEKITEIVRQMKTLAPSQRPYKGRLRWDSPEGILEQIKEGKAGNCFHYSILYSTYLSSIGIKSRLWTLEGDDGLERLTHTVAEVYIEGLKRWMLVDAFRGIYFTKENYPLSVLELRNDLLAAGPDKILVYSIFRQSDESNKMYLRFYARMLKSVFLRTSNDFVNKYDAKIRYGVLNRFQKYLDRFPSLWRRGLDYIFGRRDYLIHFVDRFSARLRLMRIIARSLFYFFVFSSMFLFTFFLIILVAKILRKFPLAINFSRKETRHR